MKDNEIIKTEDLLFDYTVVDENGDETGKNRILTDINLSIEKGSFVAVLGHNGDVYKRQTLSNVPLPACYSS